MTFRFAYFEEFKSGPKVLFWGNEAAMQVLADLLRGIANGRIEVRLDETGISADGISVTATLTKRAGGMWRAPHGDGVFDWRLDVQTADTFAEMVAVLTKPGTRGHQYLETGTPGEITVMASAGEYPPDLKL